MDPYLEPDEFRDETIMPAFQVDEIVMQSPNWLRNQLVKKTGWLESRLRKRYATPFVRPYPEAVRDWLTRIVTHVCYLRRGVDPTDAQAGEIAADRKAAEDEVLEAANCETGLFDLPLRQDLPATGIKPRVAGTAQASPYAWTNAQRNRGRSDDERGRNG